VSPSASIVVSRVFLQGKHARVVYPAAWGAAAMPVCPSVLSPRETPSVSPRRFPGAYRSNPQAGLRPRLQPSFVLPMFEIRVAGERAPGQRATGSLLVS